MNILKSKYICEYLVIMKSKLYLKEIGSGIMGGTPHPFSTDLLFFLAIIMCFHKIFF